MPEPPYQYLSSDAPVLDLSDLGATIGASEQKRQDAFDASRKFQKTMIEAQKDLEQNKGNVPELITGLQTSLAKAIESTTNKDKDNTGRIPRAGNLNQRVEDLCRFMAYHHFLQTGKMIPPSACCAGSPLGATDEEYLAGACMALCQDLSRYAMGRATARDVRSVQQARDLVHEILEYLMKFDFRNGFLRRKYDGTKYALKVRKKKNERSNEQQSDIANARVFGWAMGQAVHGDVLVGETRPLLESTKRSTTALIYFDHEPLLNFLSSARHFLSWNP